MTDTTQPTAPVAKRAEVPQYRLTEKAYLGERLCQPDEIVYWKGKPEYYMEPVNDAARAMKKKHPDTFKDPINALTIVPPKPEVPTA